MNEKKEYYEKIVSSVLGTTETITTSSDSYTISYPYPTITTYTSQLAVTLSEKEHNKLAESVAEIVIRKLLGYFSQQEIERAFSREIQRQNEGSLERET